MDPLLLFLNRLLEISSILPSPFQAWIFNATLRENILLGSPMKEAWYHQVIEACALTSDLKVNSRTIGFVCPYIVFLKS